MIPSDLRVTIVIPAYNAEKTVGLAVSGALAQGCPVCEVVVVDDGSRDGTAEVVGKYPAVKCVHQANAGPAAARNAGWKSTDSDIVIFTDSDCVPEVGWARKLIDAFTDKSVGAATGSYDIANPDSLLPRLIHEEIKQRHKGYGAYVQFFGSYNVAVRRDVLVETGGFDESYRRASGEDNDLSYKVLKKGYRIAYVPGAEVAHHHTTRLWKYMREQYTHGYWRMKLYKDHPDMAKGDDYTRLKDVAEPPLALLGLVSALALPFAPVVFLAVNVLLFVIQVPAAVGVAARLKDPSYLLLAPVTFLRGYARGWGLLRGFLRFQLGVGA